MKYLLIGDPHFQPNKLDECIRFCDFIIDTANQCEAVPVILGDLYHTHSLIHSEVLLVWKDFFKKLNSKSISLVGNHDQSASYTSKAHALLSHIDDTVVVDKAYVENDILFLPYFRNNEEFIENCNKYKECHTVICHATFIGAVYNHYLIPDGINIADVPQKNIISGHIHQSQNLLDRVWYPGSPRWMTLSDANIDKAIWLVEFNDNKMIIKKSFDTNIICKKISHVTLDESIDLSKIDLNSKDDCRIDLKGSANWISKTKELFINSNYKIRTFDTDKKQSIIKESDGISKSLNKWIDNYEPLNSSKEELIKLVKDRYGRYL